MLTRFVTVHDDADVSKFPCFDYCTSRNILYWYGTTSTSGSGVLYILGTFSITGPSKVPALLVCVYIATVQYLRVSTE